MPEYRHAEEVKCEVSVIGGKKSLPAQESTEVERPP